MKQLSPEAFQKNFVKPLQEYMQKYLNNKEINQLKAFAGDLGMHNINDVYTSLLLDSNAKDKEKPRHSGNPFKTLFLDIFTEKSKNSPGFLTEERLHLFHRIQRLYILFILKQVDHIKQLENFREKVVSRNKTRKDPLLDNEFITELEELINQKKEANK
jgi:hypothetical protein